MVTCENLVKIYTQTGVDVVALQGLDLSVQVGEIVGIVGESGSGKSTLLNILGGLDRPSAGQVTVNGQVLLKLSEAELDHYRCEQVGFVWQQTSRNLIPYLSALENVELPMRLSRLPAAERCKRATELLELVGLAERTESIPAQLSGGQQQRVAIAVALANHPVLLLADEPTGELDTSTAGEVYAVLRKANREHGATILIVSHDPDISSQVDRVVSIRDGKTSSETVRVKPGPLTTRQGHSPLEYEELLMLDSAGRVQLPREVLETLGIDGRVRLAVQDESILLQAVDGHRRASRPIQEAGEAAIFEEEPLPEPEKRTGSFAGWVRRMRRRGAG